MELDTLNICSHMFIKLTIGLPWGVAVNGAGDPIWLVQLIADIVMLVSSPILSPVHLHGPLGLQEDGQEAANPSLVTLIL